MVFRKITHVWMIFTLAPPFSGSSLAMFDYRRVNHVEMAFAWRSCNISGDAMVAVSFGALLSWQHSSFVDSGELYTFCDSEKPSSKLYKLRHLYIWTMYTIRTSSHTHLHQATKKCSMGKSRSVDDLMHQFHGKFTYQRPDSGVTGYWAPRYSSPWLTTIDSPHVNLL